jgi:glycosyltransferase involved in cell wall biosynthesis
MKILHLNTWDTRGGASRGAYSTHKALLEMGVHSQMLVAYKDSYDPTIEGSANLKIFEKIWSEIRPNLDTLPLKFYPKKQRDLFSPGWIGSNILTQLKRLNPDLINLHWICQGFLRSASLQKFQKPLVWTMRDMWPFTGGCHYADDCTGYTLSCGRCPKLGSQNSKDLSFQILKHKQQAWQNLNLTLIAPSRWMADCAKQSLLFQNRTIEVIPSAVNTQIFRPRGRSILRSVLDLSVDRKIILFTALRALQDQRKGWQYLAEALGYLSQSSLADSLSLVIVGNTTPLSQTLPIPAIAMGTLQDDLTLAFFYGAADVTVVPSLQDNFPKVPVESLACGTPVVAFDNTGCRDIIESKGNGYLAESCNAKDLAQGILWVLEAEERWQKLSARSRQTVEEKFSPQQQARAYKNLYERILQESYVSDARDPKTGLASF